MVIPLPENQPPTAQFIAEPNTGELPLTVEFDAENSSDTDGLIESYAWDFGDAVTASGVSAIHTYNTAGTYTVTLTVTDDDGEIGTYTDIIECSPDQPPFIKSATWGPIKIFKGNVGDLYIKDNTGVGSVSYDLGKSTESTYIYALDVSNGKLIGDAKISGRCFGIDICERYAFVWIRDGDINIYDLKKKFELVQTILHKNPNEPTTKRISNLGNYLYIQDSKAPDYLIDKRTLEIVNLNISNDDYIYYPLYPDCLIGDSYAFKGSDVDTPAVYSLKEGKILGYLPHDFTHFFAWDPQKKLFFYHDRDKTMVYSMSESKYISELNLSDSAGYSIIANTPTVYDSYGNMHGIVIADVSLSENGYYFLNYFLNGEENAYVLDSSGNIKCQLEKSQIIGEVKGNIIFKSNNKESLGSNQNICSTLWIKEQPNPYPGYHKGPHFTEDSISWLCSSGGLKGHGDAIYQWNYETGSYLNYTEFTGYEVDVLSSNPFILAISSDRGKPDKDWYLVCYKPSELPFNLIADIEMDYSPSEDIYAGSTQVKFTCNVKNVPEEVQSQNITYEWNFSDGTKETGKETTHTFERSGNYNVSVSVKLGDSADSSTKSMKLAVLESPATNIQLVATPQRYTAEGLTFNLSCKGIDLSEIGNVIWDFGDGGKTSSGLVASHTYKEGNYTAKATIYNLNETLICQKEISIVSKFPDLSASASPLEGNTALNVDFKCDLLSQNLTDSGLKYQWKIGTEVISEEKSFSNVFIEPRTYVVKLEVTDPDSKLVKEQSLNIIVNPPVITFDDEGRMLNSNAVILLDKNLIEKDADKDRINQAWEDAAMKKVNPYFELGKNETWLTAQNTLGHKVVNFVRITPYPSKENPIYILFFYCIAWSRDYGKYVDREVPYLNIFEAHNGDDENVVMAWKVVNDKTLSLEYVYTSAHGGESSGHSGVWRASGETRNEGRISDVLKNVFATETMYGTLEFYNNAVKLYASQDKHAIYPSISVGENVHLVWIPPVVLPFPPFYVPGWFVMENVGGSWPHRFECYNAGEPAVHLMNDISFIFPKERI